MRVGSGSDRDRNRIRSGSDPKGFARNVCRLAETAITDRQDRGPAWSTRSWDTGSRSRLSLSTLEKHLKIAACDGVLEFFPQETLVYKNVDGGRQYAGPVLSLEKADSVYVLLAPEYQLGFL